MRFKFILPLGISCLVGAGDAFSCTYVDPHNRSGYYAWCRCIGGTPLESGGNSACIPGSPPVPRPVLPATLASEYQSKWKQLRLALDDPGNNQVAREILSDLRSRFPPLRSPSSLEETYSATNELNRFLNGYALRYRLEAQRLAAQRIAASANDRRAAQLESDIVALDQKNKDRREDVDSAVKEYNNWNRKLRTLITFMVDLDKRSTSIATRLYADFDEPLPASIARWKADQDRTLITSLYLEEPPPDREGITQSRKTSLAISVIAPQYLEPAPFSPPVPNFITVDSTKEGLAELQPGPLIDAVAQYANELQLGSATIAQHALTRLDDALWNRTIAESELNRTVEHLESIKNLLPELKTRTNEAIENAAYKQARSAFWDYLEKAYSAVLQNNNDAKMMTRFRDVQRDVVEFGANEDEFLSQGVSALGSGDLEAIDRVRKHMDAAFCDFVDEVEKDGFSLPDLPKPIKSFLPNHPTCVRE